MVQANQRHHRQRFGVVEPWKHPEETGEITPEMAAANQKAESVFLLLLKAHQGPTSSAKNSPHYAPKMFAKHPTAKMAKVSQLALALALDRLLADGRVVIGSEKTHGGAREKLMVADNEG